MLFPDDETTQQEPLFRLKQGSVHSDQRPVPEAHEAGRSPTEKKDTHDGSIPGTAPGQPNPFLEQTCVERQAHPLTGPRAGGTQTPGLSSTVATVVREGTEVSKLVGSNRERAAEVGQGNSDNLQGLSSPTPSIGQVGNIPQGDTPPENEKPSEQGKNVTHKSSSSPSPPPGQVGIPQGEDPPANKSEKRIERYS